MHGVIKKDEDAKIVGESQEEVKKAVEPVAVPTQADLLDDQDSENDDKECQMLAMVPVGSIEQIYRQELESSPARQPHVPQLLQSFSGQKQQSFSNGYR